jgi:hypothetical protein
MSTSHLFNYRKKEHINAEKRQKRLQANPKKWLAEQDKMARLQEEFIKNKIKKG